MNNTVIKYYNLFHTIIKTLNNAISPIYRLTASLFILIIGIIMKSLQISVDANIFMFVGVIATFITSIKASFYYYRKSKKS